MKPLDQRELFDDEAWDSRTHSHRDDPETSSDAYAKARRSVGPQMRMVFELLLQRPMTQDELREQTGLGDNAAKRCSDLHNSGWICDSGRRGLSVRGQPAVLWMPTEFGKRMYVQRRL